MKVYQRTEPIVISRGNSKIGKIPNISLPPKTTCNPFAPCRTEGCYSMKAYRRFSSVRLARHHNYRIWLLEPDRYFQDLDNYIQTKKPPYFRFHVDGDIPSQDYLNRMVLLAETHPETRFLAFTKQYHLNFSQIPENLVIIPSAWPGLTLPESVWGFNLAWMQDGREERNRRVYFDCHGHCDECYSCWHIGRIERDVVFAKH